MKKKPRADDRSTALRRLEECPPAFQERLLSALRYRDAPQWEIVGVLDDEAAGLLVVRFREKGYESELVLNRKSLHVILRKSYRALESEQIPPLHQAPLLAAPQPLLPLQTKARRRFCNAAWWILDLAKLALPRRLGTEDLSDAQEVVAAAQIDPSVPVWKALVKTASALLWVSIAALKEFRAARFGRGTTHPSSPGRN